MRPLFKGGVYFEITFLKSLTTVTVNRLYILCTSKVAMFLLIILTRENRNCLDGADYQLVPSFFLIIRCGVYSRAAFFGNFTSICGVQSNKYGK